MEIHSTRPTARAILHAALLVEVPMDIQDLNFIWVFIVSRFTRDAVKFQKAVYSHDRSP